jgi:hypothetical protein
MAKKNWQKAGRAQRRDTQCSPERTKTSAVGHATPERTNHIHFHWRLVPPGGTVTRAARRMDEDDLGQITGSKENATDELPYVPNKFVDTQDHERPRI